MKGNVVFIAIIVAIAMLVAFLIWVTDPPEAFENQFFKQKPVSGVMIVDSEDSTDLAGTTQVVRVSLTDNILDIGGKIDFYIPLADFTLAMNADVDTLRLGNVAGGHVIFEGTKEELLAAVADTISVRPVEEQ